MTKNNDLFHGFTQQAAKSSFAMSLAASRAAVAMAMDLAEKLSMSPEDIGCP